jgi:Predicted amino acid aldolase or racemase
MLPLKEKFIKKYPNLILSTGDTPTCSLADDFLGIDELRPGNLVFYDLTQSKIGSCTIDQIAVAMACPIVAMYPQRNEIIIYGGAVHFSKDYLTTTNNITHYGQVVMLNKKGWDTAETGMYVKALSQEHGTLHASESQLKRFKPGDFVGILPVHSCLTADAMKSYLTLDGERLSRL